jgi:hypothetical protein
MSKLARRLKNPCGAVSQGVSKTVYSSSPIICYEFLKLCSIKKIFSWRYLISTCLLIITCLFLLGTPPVLAGINDDRFDGNIYVLYAGNGSLVPPKGVIGGILGTEEASASSVLRRRQ